MKQNEIKHFSKIEEYFEPDFEGWVQFGSEDKTRTIVKCYTYVRNTKIGEGIEMYYNTGI